jgi:hypothetical protein
VLSILPAKPGHYEIRAAVDGDTGGQGSVYAFVDVPDFAKAPLSLSDLLVHTVPAVSIAVPARVAGLLPTVPTARRTFGSTEHVSASLRVYQHAGGVPVPVAVVIRIVDVHDQTVFSQSASIDASRFARTRAADYAVDLPVATLAPGDYLLTIEATAGTHRVSRDLRFERSATPRGSLTTTGNED